MRRSQARSIVGIVGTLIIVVAAFFLATRSPRTSSASVDVISSSQKPVGIDLQGQPLSFDEQYAGKPVLINFWASWCVPCRAEFPLLEQASDEIAIIGIVSRDTDQNARDFVTSQGSSWRHIVDDGSLAAAWKAGPGLPVTFAVDADGVVQRRQFGELSEIDLNAMLDAVGFQPAVGD